MKIENFAKQLCIERKKAKITQSELAKTIGVSSQTISGYENGSKKPALENAIAVAEALGVSLDSLCGQNAVEEKHSCYDCISSYADIIQIVEVLTDTTNCSVLPIEETGNVTIQQLVVTIYDSEIVKFYVNRTKMQELLRNGVIDQNLYFSWEKGAIDQLKNVEPQFCGELPF